MQRRQDREPAKQRKTTVLLVEDDGFLREATTEFLEGENFAVLEARHGDEALKILTEAERDAIDVVLSDVRMPGKTNGFGLARWIIQHRPGLRVLLWSGDTHRSDLVRENCLGVELLAKPIRFRALAALLERSTKQRREKT